MKHKNAKFKIGDTVRLIRKSICLKKDLLQIGEKSSLPLAECSIPNHGLIKLFQKRCFADDVTDIGPVVGIAHPEI